MNELEERVVSALQAAGASYELMPCDPDLADTAAFCAHYGVSPSNSANTIIVASRKEPKAYVACLAPITQPIGRKPLLVFCFPS